MAAGIMSSMCRHVQMGMGCVYACNVGRALVSKRSRVAWCLYMETVVVSYLVKPCYGQCFSLRLASEVEVCSGCWVKRVGFTLWRRMQPRAFPY